MERSLAILFVDIVDSTRLYERLGNVEASGLTRGLLHVMRSTVESNRGTVVKSLGDGLLCAFDDADHAYLAATAMTKSQSDFNLKIRIGIHFGEVVKPDDDKLDIVGDAVNVSARVESLASPGEILATEDFIARLTPRVQVSTKLLVDKKAMKGKSIAIPIHQIRVPEEEDSFECTVASNADLIQRVRDSMFTMHLDYRRREYVINNDRPKVTIGRGDDCDVHILSRQASRQHGAIEFDRETFLLRDHSSNGTWVKSGSNLPLVLRRDSTKLTGSGLIGFGAMPDSEDQDHVVKFWSYIVE